MLAWKSGIATMAVASLMLACAGKSLDQPGGAIGGSGGTGSGGASGGCSQYDNEQGTVIQLRLINGTSQPIYFENPGCTSGPGFTVAFAGGAALAPANLCSTCEDALQGRPVSCPDIECPINSADTLQPGGSLLLQWSGTYSENLNLPTECPISADANACQRVVGVKPGTYTFSAQAGTAIACGDAICPPCKDDGEGDCYTPAAAVSGTVLSAHTDVTLDASYGVGVGAASNDTARVVELTFQN